MRRPIASAALHMPSAVQLRSSCRSWMDRAIASEKPGAIAAISSGGTVRQKLNSP
jgi:hypothetical protein